MIFLVKLLDRWVIRSACLLSEVNFSVHIRLKWQCRPWFLKSTETPFAIMSIFNCYFSTFDLKDSQKILFRWAFYYFNDWIAVSISIGQSFCLCKCNKHTLEFAKFLKIRICENTHTKACTYLQWHLQMYTLPLFVYTDILVFLFTVYRMFVYTYIVNTR